LLYIKTWDYCSLGYKHYNYRKFINSYQIDIIIDEKRLNFGILVEGSGADHIINNDFTANINFEYHDSFFSGDNFKLNQFKMTQEQSNELQNNPKALEEILLKIENHVIKMSSLSCFW